MTKSSPTKGEGTKLIATNQNARRNYFIEDVLEAGIVLVGTEVKSLRLQSPNLGDSYVEVHQSGSRFEAFLVNAHFSPYSHGNIWNHDPLRKRKLLMHFKELDRLHGALTKKGLSVIPLRMYFKGGKAKVEIGLGKGKKSHDKREDLKKRSAEREMDQARKREKR